MSSRRLKQPLDGGAVATANRKLWRDHPELSRRHLTMDSADAAYRTEWATNYLAAGGSVETEANAPLEQTVVPCPTFDCAAAWKECEAAADAITNKSHDPLERNRFINAAYAQMYLNNPKLEWLGAAAFASKQVGCGLKAAKDAMDIAEGDRRWSVEGADPILQVKGAFAKPVFESLANGNRAVFKDIYPCHLFYEKYGLDKLQQCAGARQPRVDKKVLDGFQDIEDGHSAVGALKILQHEQLDLLQTADVFGNKEVQEIMELNQSASERWYGRLLGAQPTGVSFTPECTGDPYVQFEGVNPADHNERWPFARDVVNAFDDLKNTPGIRNGLEALIQRGK